MRTQQTQRSNTTHQRTHRPHLRVVKDPNSVEERLKAAFPEIDLEKIASGSPTLNMHNLGEKWAATVRSIQYWMDMIHHQ